VLLFLSQEGEVLKELRLPIQKAPEDVKYSNPANIGDNRFVVSVSSQGIGSAAQWSLAVLARTQSGASGTYSINSYSSSGDARKIFDLPFPLDTIERLAYNGRHVFIRVENDLFVYGLDGQALGQFTLPPEAKITEWKGPWLAMQGKELWFVESQGRKLHRFAVNRSPQGWD
jgi:hypothetical protein